MSLYLILFILLFMIEHATSYAAMYPYTNQQYGGVGTQGFYPYNSYSYKRPIQYYYGQGMSPSVPNPMMGTYNNYLMPQQNRMAMPMYSGGNMFPGNPTNLYNNMMPPSFPQTMMRPSYPQMMMPPGNPQMMMPLGIPQMMMPPAIPQMMMPPGNPQMMMPTAIPQTMIPPLNLMNPYYPQPQTFPPYMAPQLYNARIPHEIKIDHLEDPIKSSHEISAKKLLDSKIVPIQSTEGSESDDVITDVIVPAKTLELLMTRYNETEEMVHPTTTDKPANHHGNKNHRSHKHHRHEHQRHESKHPDNEYYDEDSEELEDEDSHYKKPRYRRSSKNKYIQGDDWDDE